MVDDRYHLTYSALTATLALIYAGSVVLLQGMFATVGDQQSSIAIVLSTLAIAALFTPLRRVQDAIDRRFFRRKYDAAQTLAAFAQIARDEVNLETLTTELLHVVETTIQPEQVSIWLKPTE